MAKLVSLLGMSLIAFEFELLIGLDAFKALRSSSSIDDRDDIESSNYIFVSGPIISWPTLIVKKNVLP